MEILAAITVGCLMAIGVWMLLDRNLLRVVLGVAIIGNAINMAVITAGRFGLQGAAFVDAAGASGGVANPLPQALVLTAIVIGFGLFVFALAMLLRVWRSHGSCEADRVTAHGEDPAPDGVAPGPEDGG